jgi:hypothetical protein
MYNKKWKLTTKLNDIEDKPKHNTQHVLELEVYKIQVSRALFTFYLH